MLKYKYIKIALCLGISGIVAASASQESLKEHEEEESLKSSHSVVSEYVQNPQEIEEIEESKDAKTPSTYSRLLQAFDSDKEDSQKWIVPEELIKSRLLFSKDKTGLVAALPDDIQLIKHTKNTLNEEPLEASLTSPKHFNNITRILMILENLKENQIEKSEFSILSDRNIFSEEDQSMIIKITRQSYIGKFLEIFPICVKSAEGIYQIIKLNGKTSCPDSCSMLAIFANLTSFLRSLNFLEVYAIKDQLLASEEIRKYATPAFYFSLARAAIELQSPDIERRDIIDWLLRSISWDMWKEGEKDHRECFRITKEDEEALKSDWIPGQIVGYKSKDETVIARCATNLRIEEKTQSIEWFLSLKPSRTEYYCLAAVLSQIDNLYFISTPGFPEIFKEALFPDFFYNFVNNEKYARDMRSLIDASQKQEERILKLQEDINVSRLEAEELKETLSNITLNILLIEEAMDKLRIPSLKKNKKKLSSLNSLEKLNVIQERLGKHLNKSNTKSENKKNNEKSLQTSQENQREIEKFSSIIEKLKEENKVLLEKQKDLSKASTELHHVKKELGEIKTRWVEEQQNVTKEKTIKKEQDNFISKLQREIEEQKNKEQQRQKSLNQSSDIIGRLREEIESLQKKQNQQSTLIHNHEKDMKAMENVWQERERHLLQCNQGLEVKNQQLLEANSQSLIVQEKKENPEWREFFEKVKKYQEELNQEMKKEADTIPVYNNTFCFAQKNKVLREFFTDLLKKIENLEKGTRIPDLEKEVERLKNLAGKHEQLIIFLQTL